MDFLLTLLASVGNIVPHGINPLDIAQLGLDWEGFWDWTMPDFISDEYNNTGAAINAYVIDLCNVHIMKYAMALCEDFTGAARYLGAIFAIIVAARQAYKIMAEGDRFEILDVLRPIIFAFVLSFWPAVCTTLLTPGAQVEKYFRQQYITGVQRMEELRKERSEKAGDVTMLIATRKISSEKAADKSSSSWWNPVKELTDLAFDVMRSAAMALTTYILMIIEKLVIGLGEIAISVCVYIVFLTKVLYITVLVMFGPIHMVCSILEVWKTSWSTWIGRVVSVSMYGAMAYLVLTFSMLLICYSLDADIKKLEIMLQNPDDGVFSYIKGGFGTTIMTATAYIVGAVAMSQVYELASLVFPSQGLHGAGSFIGGMKQQAVKRTKSGEIF